MNNRKRIKRIGYAVLAVGLVLVLWALIPQEPSPRIPFDGTRALADVEYQVSLGSRTPGSPGHAQVANWIQSSLEQSGWDHEVQTGELLGNPIQNILGKRGRGEPWIIIGAHYDTRFYADNDPDIAKQDQPVPGANDGASGVAALLELARTIPDEFPGEIWLVFFDAEDNGRIQGWDWILGSRYFVDHLSGKPDAVVILDMIGDADLNVFMEKNSDPELTQQIWEQADSLGYADHFIPSEKYRMIDDHTPFLQADIPAVDIIDFDYPYWHTTEDTVDKVSAESLQMVGDTMLAWLETMR